MLDRELVHKRQAENVFVGVPVRCGPREFSSPAEFPCSHCLYNDTPSGLSGAGYLIEVARQSNLAICHMFYDVPLDSGFLVAALDWCFSRPRPFVVEELEAFEVRTEIVEAVIRKGVLAKVSTESRFFDSYGVEFLAGKASFLITSRKLTTRGARPEPVALGQVPMAPHRVMVTRPYNVFVGEPNRPADGTTETNPLIIDVTHPYFFEHENAHVPGMMLLEAGKQAAVFAAPRRFPIIGDCYGDLCRGEIRFTRFAELYRPVSIACAFGSLHESADGFQAPVDITFEQAGREIGRIQGDIAFVDQADAVTLSALRRQQLDSALSQVSGDVPMSWAFE